MSYVTFDRYQNPVATTYGPPTWACLHAFASIYSPEMEQTARALVDTLIGGFPCGACAQGGMRYLQAHPLDYSSREAFARSIWAFHNAVNEHIGKPLYPWRDSLVVRL
jgi:hypothetical protein